jgi:hypothetical protein
MQTLPIPRAIRTLAATALMTALLSGLSPTTLGAQARQAPREEIERLKPRGQPAEPAQPVFDEQNAQQTRERLREVLNQYPPSVGQVLRLDPSLLERPEYLASYPALAQFLAQHPAIVHNPGYFLGFVQLSGRGYDTPDSARAEGMRAIRDTFGGLFFLLGFSWVVGMIGYIARSVIEYRAWLRASKVQTEAHAKLLDRLTSNQDVLAYVQSPVGQRYLTTASLTSDFGARSVGSPAGRILWSAQIGIVLALGGFGLFIARNNVIDEAAQALYVVAIVAIALGIGFALSAIAAYALSKQLGLLEPHTPSTHA